MTVPSTDAIRSLPKVSLHDHLDGGLRPETVFELAREQAVELPAPDAAALADWFAEQADSDSLVEYLRTFALTIAVMQTREALIRVAREFVEDLVADGVVYAEVRWAPEQHLQRGLTLEEAVEAVREGFAQGEAAADGRIWVRQILSAMRQADRSLEIARLALAFRDRGVVAFDLAGPEDGFPPAGHREALDLLAAELFPVTLHAGEAAGLDSIRGALIDGRALRLGHGVRIAEDVDGDRLGPVATWVRDRGIALELSPSSNLGTGAIACWGTTMADHPFDRLRRRGFRVTVNTDNRLMSRTTLTRELALLAEAFGYSLDDLRGFQVAAAEAAFLPAPERIALVARVAG